MENENFPERVLVFLDNIDGIIKHDDERKFRENVVLELLKNERVTLLISSRKNKKLYKVKKEIVSILNLNYKELTLGPLSNKQAHDFLKKLTFDVTGEQKYSIEVKELLKETESHRLKTEYIESLEDNRSLRREFSKTFLVKQLVGNPLHIEWIAAFKNSELGPEKSLVDLNQKLQECIVKNEEESISNSVSETGEVIRI